MIGFQSIAFSAYGPVVILDRGSAKTMDNRRRVSRSATLDGGCVITDRGFSDGDRTVRLRTDVDESARDVLWSWFRTSSGIVLSLDDGCYTAYLESLSFEGTEMDAKILIKERLSA